MVQVSGVRITSVSKSALGKLEVHVFGIPSLSVHFPDTTSASLFPFWHPLFSHLNLDISMNFSNCVNSSQDIFIFVLYFIMCNERLLLTLKEII